MAKILNKIIFSVICFTFFLFLAFKSCVLNSFCLADPSFTLDSNTLSLLQGGQTSGINGMNYYGLNCQGYDPYSLFVLGAAGDVISKTDQYLSTNYGFDLQDCEFGANDTIESLEWNSLTADSVVGNLSLGSISSFGDLIRQGADILVSKAIVGGLSCKTIMAGVVDDVTGKITSLIGNGNAYVNLSDSFIDNLDNCSDYLVNNNDVVDISSSNVKFGKNLEFTGQGFHYVFRCSLPILCYNYSAGGSIYALFPYNSYDVSPASLTIVDISTGTVISSDSFGITSNNGTLTIGGSLYMYAELIFSRDRIYSDTLFSQSDAINFISDYDPYNSGFDYNVGYSNPNNIKALFDLLRNKWVTTDDLRQINDKINKLTLGNIVIDGSQASVIITDSDSISDLEDLIQDIIDRNAIINNDSKFDDYLDSNPNPDPDPDPSDPSWPDVPDDIPDWMVGVIPDLLPDEMFSIFKPVFDIVGTDYSMHSTFIAIPAILIIAFVVYFIVSVF